LAVPTFAAPPSLEEQIDVRLFRQSLRIKQHEVATALGLSIGFVCLVERRIVPRPAIESRIRRYLIKRAQQMVT
jgi:hypothetical protein